MLNNKVIMTEETYGHPPIKKMFDLADGYGIGFDKKYYSRKKIRLGIIGVGGISQSKHIPAINRLITTWEQIELVAISEINKEQGKKIARIYNCKLYYNYVDMIKNEKLDGVIISTPYLYHFEPALYCLKSGINVLLEKPFTLLLSEGKILCDYAKEKGLILMAVSQKRFSPPYRKAKQILKDGVVENPALFCGKFNHGFGKKKGNLLFEDGAIHLFDLARYFMGDVSEVYSIGVNKYKKTNYPVDFAIINFKFSSGSIGNIYTTNQALSLKPWERIEIYGDNRWIAIEDQAKLILYEGEEEPAKYWEPLLASTLLFDEEFGGYTGLIENFVQAIRGKEEPLVTGWDGFKAYELSVASHLSLKHKEAVSLPLDIEESEREIKEWLNFVFKK